MGDDTELDNKSDDLLSALLAKAERLSDALRAYQTCLHEHGNQKDVEIRAFRRGVESEVKSLRTISERSTHDDSKHRHGVSESDSDEHEPKYMHALKSSNLSFYEAVWHYAKQSARICALSKQMSYIPTNSSPVSKDALKTSRSGRRLKDKHSVIVDIVADDGRHWIKVSTITEKRLLFEMAKQGWEAYGDYSDSDEDNNDDVVDQNQFAPPPKLEMVQLAEQMKRISRAHRARYQHPTVTFVLSKVREGVQPDIDAFIADLRGTGVRVVCADTSQTTDDRVEQSLSHLSLDSNDFDYVRLLPSPPISVVTPVLNIDCTVLLSLISDISHVTRPALPPSAPTKSGSYHNAIVKQIESEEKVALLPTELYPVICNRHLLCTSYAARRMLDIVETMGTDTEKLRADIIFATGNYEGSDAETLRAALAKVTAHPVPPDLQLPIERIIFDADVLSSPQPAHSGSNPMSTSETRPVPIFPASDTEVRIATQVVSYIQPPLSIINRSVFLYGWLHNTATVTSNRVVANQLSKAINEVLDLNEKNTNDARTAKDIVTTSPNPTAVKSASNLDDSKREDQDGDRGKSKEAAPFVGPRLYVCDTARSLVGKEKQSRFLPQPEKQAR